MLRLEKEPHSSLEEIVARGKTADEMQRIKQLAGRVDITGQSGRLGPTAVRPLLLKQGFRESVDLGRSGAGPVQPE